MSTPPATNVSLPAMPSPVPAATAVPAGIPHLMQFRQPHAIAFPYSVNEFGRTTQVDDSQHIQQMIHQLLFTSPGERVNRPLFGCDLRSLVFSARKNELGIAVESMVQGTLSQWLGDRIKVQGVTLQYGDASVSVDVRYSEISSGQTWFVRFQGRG